MDTDGWVERWGSARFCSTSERLAGNVAELVRSLGGWCSVRGRRTTYSSRGEKRGGRRAFVCNVHYPDPNAIFGLSVKRDRALASPQRRWRPVFVSVEPTRVTDTQCIAVTHPTRLYVTDDYVVTHNTAFALNVAQHVGIHLRGRVLVLSLEMSAQQIVQRMLCSEAKVDSQAVRTGYPSSSDWHRLTAAAGRLSEAQIFIDDSPGLTVLSLHRKPLYREDLPPDEVTVADVIIGKQRNGPVGTVKVAFLPQYARFENVAESHRQPQPF